MSKGQGFSLNVIVIAAIALIVLVVLIVIFTRQSGTFVENVNSCEAKGGICEPATGGCPKDKPGIILTPDCAKEEEKTGSCCFNPLGN